jgi:site-specific DNA recombinase
VIGGKPFSRGALYLMLRNRTYRGEIVHQGQSHPGEHPPIIDHPRWDAVQERLAGSTAERSSGTRTHQPSLLAGMLFDAESKRMTPSYAVKKGTRYRYYVTQDQRESSTALRIPAGEIEHLVASRVRQWLLDPGGICQATPLADPSAQRRLIARVVEIGKSWTELPGTRQRAVLTTLIERIEVGAHQIDTHLRPTRLATLIDVAATPLPSTTEDEIQILSIPVRLRRSGRAITMLIEGTDPFATPKPDGRLVKLLIRARRFNATLLDSDGVPFAALAKRQGVSPSYLTRLVRLSYLAPDIKEAILDGQQPRDLTADKLLAHSRLPLGWHEQRTVLGFA